ncbi:MAG: sigma 54-interacting transcriptional regulator, partial [Calditrichaeota bacterium]|nr:sigma 54-interacting transcriptional regulator [Calditrichota bacterium]
FISVDMGAISETRFESQLFGHIKGAFTGAKEDRPGRFEIADGGTLFLDEIGNLSMPLQAKILTV